MCPHGQPQGAKTGSGAPQGRLVALEGASGVGKSTALANLERSRDPGLPLALKLPSTGPLGQLARDFLEQGLGLTVALTAAADRAFVAETEIVPALAANRTVLLDRYVMSALALNRLDGMPFDESFGLCSRLPRPDRTILLVGDPAALTARLDGRMSLDRYERGEAALDLSEHQAFLEASAYLTACGWQITHIDVSTLDAAEVAAAIGNILASASGRS